MLRVIALLGGLCGGLGLSQFPEFSQQYLQRLAGTVDALRAVAADFDRAAERNRLTRAQALERVTGSQLLNDHRADLMATFARFERLGADLEDLRAASPLMRLTMPLKMGDMETLSGTWADYRPALPVTSDGFVAAGVGFVAGWAVMAVAGGVVGRVRRRRRARREPRVGDLPSDAAPR